MDNTILNIRFGTYHLQVVRFSDWVGEFKMKRSPITFKHNPYQAEARVKDLNWKWFEFYR